MRSATQKDIKKDEERRILERVAYARGTPLVNDDSRHPDAFPDGVFDEGDRERPVEVVDAFEREPGENPLRGSRWKRAHLQAWKDAQKIQQAQQVPAAWGAHGGTPFAIPLDGTALIPMRSQPIYPEKWVAVAVEQKLARYGPKPDLVLVVHLHSPLDLDRFQLEWLSRRHAALGAPFRELWVANDYGTPAQRVPASVQT